MMAADYRHIGSLENRLGRHYSRFWAFWPAPALAGQSLALRKLCDAGSNRRSRARETDLPSSAAQAAVSISPDRSAAHHMRLPDVSDPLPLSASEANVS